MTAAHVLSSWILVAGIVILMLRTWDYKGGGQPCVVCGQRGQHAIGCTGRR